MTDVEKIKDAIGDLKAVHTMYDVMCGDWSFCWTAIEALEKQIPKKPIVDERYVKCICPKCWALLTDYQSFCDNCGQAVLWEMG